MFSGLSCDPLVGSIQPLLKGDCAGGGVEPAAIPLCGDGCYMPQLFADLISRVAATQPVFTVAITIQMWASMQPEPPSYKFLIMLATCTPAETPPAAIDKQSSIVVVLVDQKLSVLHVLPVELDQL